MPTQVLICDDSSLARRQLARSLPKDWDVDVSFAGNGHEALAGIRAGKGDLLFLDLNMPDLSGYDVLEAIRKDDLPTMTVVISGDIQPEASQRVMALGALAFIKKPVSTAELSAILDRFGLRGESAGAPMPASVTDIAVLAQDGYKEIANVAMGRAADLLARLLDVFVIMPIPTVNTLEVGELQMALEQVNSNDTISAVCQGFIGSGIAGEALLIFNESSFTNIAELMKYDGDVGDAVQLELLMDISSVLIGAFLQGIADQFELRFSQGHPVVLGRHIRIGDLLKRSASRWTKTLAIEMGYRIENYNINCDLLVLFTEDSIEPMDRMVKCLAG